MSFEKILNIIGGAKRYQIEVLLIMIVAKAFPGIVTLVPVFIAARQQYYCNKPYFSNNSNEHCSLQTKNNVTIECSSWTFENDPVDSTLQSQYSLTCSNELLANLTTTFYFLGFMVGCTLYGKTSDKFGRRINIIISACHLCFAAIASAFAPWYWLYGILRFLTGIGNGGLLATLFTMGSEAPETRHRVFWSVNVHQGWSVGVIFMSLMAFFVRNHFHLQLILYCPIILVVPLVALFVKESPRWLFVNRETEKLNYTIKYIAKRNGVALNSNFSVEKFYDDKVKSKDRTFSELWNFRAMRKVTLIVWLDWFVVSISFFAASLGVGSLGGNVFINTAISAAIEIPARFLDIFLTEKLGRIPTLSISYAVGGICGLINAYLYGKAHLALALTISAMIAKLGFTMAFDIIWLYSAEIFPTEIRNLGVGVGSTWARVGGTLSTLVGELGRLWGPAPFVLLGILPLIASLASCFLPETKGIELPETLEEGEELAKHGNAVMQVCGCCNQRISTQIQPTEIAVQTKL